MTLTNSETGSNLQSVDRALQVLELLAVWGSGGVSELANEIGVHKSTAFRLLGALEAREMVEQLNERGKYRLGFGLVRLARRVNVQHDLAEQARPLTDKLAALVGESINVAVLREHFAVNIVQSRGQASVVSQNWIGQLTPLHATSSGKVLLAYLDAGRRDDLLARGLDRYTGDTHTDTDALRRELTQIADLRYAVSFGELEAGLNAVAVPVRGEDGAVIAALSASGPAYRLGPERVDEVVRRLDSAADDLSRRMGYWGEDG
ncbi:IclR family transcriptional regulator [Microlunatus ginsengisoli]|uniref:IclR family transcriptional regulator n=1 Tax=Microlunatus ginsengisoli TaxID=363863 RepID=A0ABP7AX51_9ACTN